MTRREERGEEEVAGSYKPEGSTVGSNRAESTAEEKSSARRTLPLDCISIYGRNKAKVPSDKLTGSPNSPGEKRGRREVQEKRKNRREMRDAECAIASVRRSSINGVAERRRTESEGKGEESTVAVRVRER